MGAAQPRPCLSYLFSSSPQNYTCLIHSFRAPSYLSLSYRSTSAVTLKALNFVSTMRTNLDLIQRSSYAFGPLYSDCKRQICLNLEKGILNYPPLMKSLGLREGQTLSERKQVLNVPSKQFDRCEAELDFMKFCGDQVDETRAATWIFRIGSETSEMCDRGWFPFFVTLTVDPSRVSDPAAMWQEGREWRKYIRRVCKVVTDKMGHQPAHKSMCPESDYVRYAGVLEHGSSAEHHHMHCLIWMRDVPESWKLCPNRRIHLPKYRNRQRCLQLETLWPHAAPENKPALYFRHQGDIWSKIGFITPILKTGLPLTLRPAATAGVYLAKYMTKEDKVWHHRVKATRNLGLDKIKARLWKMNAQRVEALTWRPRSYQLHLSVTTTHIVPPALIRSLAKQILFCKRWVGKQHNFNKELQPSCSPFNAMLASVKNGPNPRKMRSQQRYDWVTDHLPVPDGYSERRLKNAHKAMQHLYPVTHWQNSTNLGANDFGFTSIVSPGG